MFVLYFFFVGVFSHGKCLHVEFYTCVVFYFCLRPSSGVSINRTQIMILLITGKINTYYINVIRVRGWFVYLSFPLFDFVTLTQLSDCTVGRQL